MAFELKKNYTIRDINQIYKYLNDYSLIGIRVDMNMKNFDGLKINPYSISNLNTKREEIGII